MLQCLDPFLTIAALLTARSPFVSPMERREEAAGAWLKFAGNSKRDHMVVVVAYNGWLNARQDGWDAESNYLSGNFLLREVLAGIEASRSDYLQILADLGFVPGLKTESMERSQSWTEPLRFLLQKELTITDVVELRRIILLKKDAESKLP
ncbi:unnamed protein product [Sphagnum compactum]